jgi:glycosyltransferase involved in cell wall biosynthesis
VLFLLYQGNEPIAFLESGRKSQKDWKKFNMTVQTSKKKNESSTIRERHISQLSSYPLDMSRFFKEEFRHLHSIEELYHANPGGYLPIIMVWDALVCWNRYLVTGESAHSYEFLSHARWLVEYEVRLKEDAGGWPMFLMHPSTQFLTFCLSSSMQGCAISVLMRAYLLTKDEAFLEVTQRVVHTFERDILDGGVCAPVTDQGVFFEEVAVYPALHTLSGFIFSLFGLYDYVAVTGDGQVECLIRRSLATMHDILDEFDTSFWTRADLLHRHVSTPSQLSLQVALLEALASYSGCEHCAALATRWNDYRHQLISHLRYLLTTFCTSSCQAVWKSVGAIFFHKKPGKTAEETAQEMLRVCIPIPAFPVAGGMRGVLAKTAEVTKDIWQLEFLTHYVGPNQEGLIIHRFGTRKMAPWQFPSVWLYTFAGFCKLVSLLRKGATYDLILVQDGVFTAAFGAMVAKMAGIRSVCIDHGNLGLLNSRAYRTERLSALETTNWSWPRRLFARLRYRGYWPSLSILARIGALFVDHYFIPGVAGDGVEEICKSLGVPQSRITRFANMIEIERHVIPDEKSRAKTRERYGISEDAVIIAIICRLAPEKGLEIALEAISQSLSTLPPEVSKRVRIIIAGDGPLRKQLEKDIYVRGLTQTCLLWGEASAQDVITILGVSDIFLFTSWRAAGCPLTVLEAMASGRAVIASTESLANQKMLAEERGVVLPVGDTERIGRAIVKLVSDPELRRLMGTLARNYVAVHHNADVFRRDLLRVSYWSELDKSLEIEGES